MKHLTADQLYHRIKHHGDTFAMTTEKLHYIPKGTGLWFTTSREGDCIDSGFSKNVYEKNRNKSFDIAWAQHWHDVYKGKFIVFNETNQTKLLNQINIRQLNV